MRKLFLTSVDFSKFLLLTKKKAKDLKVAFIPTAADPYKDKWFVDEDRKKFRQLGINFFEVDIKNKTKQELLERLNNIDVIYVSGGNTFYLLEKVRESHFDEIVTELVNKGVIYVGGSAGAVLVCPTIETITLLDDPSKAPKLKSFKGLGLVDFIILPHYGNKKYEDKYQKIMKKYSKEKYKIITLTDKQAIIVKDDSYRIIKV